MLTQQSTLDHPWVLKQVDLNNGAGITILPPNSQELRHVLSTAADDHQNTTYIIQRYICNELTWYGGQKFDLRFFWLVISVDPLIVLFEDGYVRVSASQYQEEDFHVTGQHLTNHLYRGGQDDSATTTATYLWNRVYQHWDSQKDVNPTLAAITDPIRHVRNQMKHSIASLVSAFEPGMLRRAKGRLVHKPKKKNQQHQQQQEQQAQATASNPTATSRDDTSAASDEKDKTTRYYTHEEENFFGFYGCDFIIDKDLDVFLIEAQASPGLPDSRMQEWRRLFVPMMDLVEEIAVKQTTNATANIFPLDNLGGWDVVYVGNDNAWMFQYHDYQRSRTKTSCNVANTAM
jgi:hypothetical protein